MDTPCFNSGMETNQTPKATRPAWADLASGPTVWTPEDGWTDPPPTLTEEDAIARGQAAASWVELNEADARLLVEDIDPEVWDRYQPSPPLSGEWAGDPLPKDCVDPDAYEEAFYTSYWEDVQALAWRVLNPGGA